jgi:transcriptional regulator with XRE-family HTH domain
MTFGKYLKYKRKINKLTQQDLADKLNVSDKTISKWENDLYLPDIDNIKALSKVLNTSIFELVNHEDYNNYSNKELNSLKTNEVNNKRIINKIIIFLLLISIFFNIYSYLNNKATIYYIKNYNISGVFVKDKISTLYLSRIIVDDINLSNIKYYNFKIMQDNTIVYNYISETNDLLSFLEDLNIYIKLKDNSKNIKIIIEFDSDINKDIEYDILLEKE